MNIKDIVENNTVRFLRYRQGMAYYSVHVPNDGDYLFPVPLNDIGSATLQQEDKAIVFMHYIREAIENGTFVRAIVNQSGPRSGRTGPCSACS